MEKKVKNFKPKITYIKKEKSLKEIEKVEKIGLKKDKEQKKSKNENPDNEVELTEKRYNKENYAMDKLKWKGY